MLEPCCHRFMAAEGGARLAATAAVQNTLVTECGAFISTRLLHEEAYNIRGLLSTGRQRSVRICQAINVKPDAYELRILTDLQVAEAQDYDDVEDWTAELETKEVLVCASRVLSRILEEGVLTMAQINVLVIDSAHLYYKDEHLQYIMKIYKQSQVNKRPRILALTYPLFTSPKKDIDKSDNEVTTDNVQICETQTTDDDTVKAIENVDRVDDVEIEKKADKVEEIGVYENLDDFEMYDKLEWKIDQLEEDLCCKMDLAEDIDGCKRISGPVTKPKEVIIEYSAQQTEGPSLEDYDDLQTFMRSNVQDTLDFMYDHRHDPTEIYGEEMYDEFKNIPDPTVEPKQMFIEFLYVLDELGPYAADKAAFNLLIKLEKSKIKVPYERHFLLLRLCTSVFVKIRCYAEIIFNKYTSDWDKIRLFSTPKLLRFIEILEQFTPPELKETQSEQTVHDAGQNVQDKSAETFENGQEKSAVTFENGQEIFTVKFENGQEKSAVKFENGQEKSAKEKGSINTKMDACKLMKDLEQCDFTSLGNRIEDRLNTIESNLKELDDVPTVTGDSAKDDESQCESRARGMYRRAGRARARRPARTAARASHAPPWSLCGIVFMQHAFMAKIMFMLCVEVSRCVRGLSELRTQYCVVGPAAADTPRQGKLREEVLKKFRMHECNLLLTTSALEEGIDLPRCNLVLRWDLPASYRSHALCRSRGRAPRALSAVLCKHSAHEDTTSVLLHNVATYTELDQLITRKCGCGIQDEPSPEEEAYADLFTSLVKPYTPTEQAPCTCKEKMEKNIENQSRKIRITEIENSSELLQGDLKKVESDEKLVESDVKFVESDVKLVESDVKLVESDTSLENKLNSNEVPKSKTIQNVAQLVSKHIESVSEIVESVSKSIESVCRSIDSVSESINDFDSDISNTQNDTNKSNSEVHTEIDGNKLNNHIEDVLSTNIKNLELFNKNSDLLSDNNQCTCDNEVASVDLSTAIALINRYCAKLPSDTFTRLAPQWWCQMVPSPTTGEWYVCTLRLPLNCPNKYNIVGHPMPTRVLARRMVALQACRILHKSGELDNQLMPIGKENFKAVELESTNMFNTISEKDMNEAARPGTTKRRQYYYKRTAAAFTDCQPVIDTSDTEIDPPKHATNTKHAQREISDVATLKDVSKITTEIIDTLQGTTEFTKKLDIDSANDAPKHTQNEMGDVPNKNDVTETTNDNIDVNQKANENAENSDVILAKNKEIKDFITQTPSDINDAIIQREFNKSNFKSNLTEDKEKCDVKAISELKDNAHDSARNENIDGDVKAKTESKNCDVMKVETEKEKSGKETSIDDEKRGKKTESKRNMLYAIVSSLWCGLPERYNTRGRRLHAPQHASQALGILMARTDSTNLQIPSFPVYTRSGEVRVSVEYVPDADVRVSPRRGRLVRRFMRFVFTEVLRVRRRGMRLQSEGSTKNNYYIVPTIKTIKEDGTQKIDIDWPFLELIYQHTEEKKLSDVEKPLLWYQDEEESELIREESGGDGERLSSPLLKEGETFVFDVEMYSEAVVTPWYRNRDQPQFFLVAEICWNLTPDSAFPSAAHDSFRSYYRAKYNVELTQSNQPLLDVDHTSARLNLLTPRYVNRKGVALPVSSERTRRAKRDRLDQKQILVPELCRVHPFAAPLWFATVALPCVLYRINALLIADEIRRAVALDVGLGIPKIDNSGATWPPLDFGWSLSEVLNADAEKTEKKKEEEKEKEREQKDKELKDKEELDKVEPSTEVKEEETTEEEEKKTINDILAEKEGTESGFEIGTWSNEMASSIPDSEYDEMMEPLPPNLTFCTSASGGVNWCDPIQKTKNEYNPNRGVYADSDCSYISSDFDTDDSDFEHEGSDDDTDTSGFCSSRTSNTAVGVRIEYKTAHEAEAVDLERKRKCPPAPVRDHATEVQDRKELIALLKSGEPDPKYVEKFRQSVEKHKSNIISKGNLIKKDTAITDLLPELPETKDSRTKSSEPIENRLEEIFPDNEKIKIVDGQITLESIEKNKRVLLSKFKESLTKEEIKKLHCFSMKDIDIDSPNYVNEKVLNVGFDSKEKYVEKVLNCKKREFVPYFNDSKGQNGKEFDFDYQPDLDGHPGPSPSVILQALTMSNANDGINLERLETIGDSYLKFAITTYLYCAHATVHEGKLSHMRSKQVSNLNLYRLGRAKHLGARMIASKFEPHDNWLPPCHKAPPSPPAEKVDADGKTIQTPPETTGCYIPYNLITQHSIPDKSIADCVEALIGAYLLECGPRGALLFMSWLGINVLPLHKIVLPNCDDDSLTNEKPGRSPKRHRIISTSSDEGSVSECASECGSVPGCVGARGVCVDENGQRYQIVYGELKAPPSPLLRYIEDPEGELEQMLSGYDALERTLQYRFSDRSLLLQALTHASHQRNRLTDCYQRLEFLGDAILDYLITRHLYEDPRRHCPGALTDLRSALVNNTIFATLAVRHGFHKYFRHMSPGLNDVLTKYVRIQEENGHSISEEHYLIQEDELEQAEDVEVPKALGDLFESVAGAIFLDSGMSLGAVWKSYVRLMGAELEAFSAAAPKSPVRELLEAEPDTAKFGKPERLADGRRVRVCVEVFGRGTFKGIGRNYRIAKGTAARCALRHLRGLHT